MLTPIPISQLLAADPRLGEVAAVQTSEQGAAALHRLETQSFHDDLFRARYRGAVQARLEEARNVRFGKWGQFLRDHGLKSAKTARRDRNLFQWWHLKDAADAFILEHGKDLVETFSGKETLDGINRRLITFMHYQLNRDEGLLEQDAIAKLNVAARQRETEKAAIRRARHAKAKQQRQAMIELDAARKTIAVLRAEIAETKRRVSVPAHPDRAKKPEVKPGSSPLH